MAAWRAEKDVTRLFCFRFPEPADFFFVPREHSEPRVSSFAFDFAQPLARSLLVDRFASSYLGDLDGELQEIERRKLRDEQFIAF